MMSETFNNVPTGSIHKNISPKSLFDRAAGDGGKGNGQVYPAKLAKEDRVISTSP